MFRENPAKPWTLNTLLLLLLTVAIQPDQGLVARCLTAGSREEGKSLYTDHIGTIFPYSLLRTSELSTIR